MFLKTKKKITFFLLCSLVSTAHARDLGQMMPGQEGSEESFREQYGEVKGDREETSTFVHGDGFKKEQFEDISEEESFAVPTKDEEPKENLLPVDPDSLKTGISVTGSMEDRKNYLEFEKSELVEKNLGKANYAFHITYMRDGFTYQDPDNAFQQTYEEPEDTARYGLLQLNFDDYLYRSWVNLAWRASAGVGYLTGKGIFSQGEESEATFKLWTLPLDLGLTLEIPLGNWMKFVGSAGPSVVGIIQNRSDLETGAADKTKRQFSTGFYYEGGVSVNMSKYFRDMAYDMFSQYEITGFYLTLKLRSHTYEKFQDELSISGQSLGFGVTFDYL